jgi:hypothetical protein
LIIPKVLFAIDATFDVGNYYPKFSLLAFYYHIIHETNKKLRLALYATTVYAALAAFGTVVIDLLWCGPRIADNWYSDRFLLFERC